LLLASRDGNRPLGESLLFHQARFSGIVGRWYRRLAADLQNGAPWTDAIWNNRRALPREAAAYARLYQNATPAEAAAGEASENRDMGLHQLRQSVSQQFAYLTTIVAMAVAVLAFTGIKIIPSYQSILEDFSMQMPSSTQSLVVFFDMLGDGAELPLIVLGLVLALLIVAVINIFYLCDRPILQPLTDHFGFARHQAQVLRLLALAAGQQIPIHEALHSLAAGRGCYSSGVVRRRLAAASRKISAGAEWQTALQKSSLLDGRDAAMLRAAQEVGNLPWTMRFLADRKLILLASRWSVWFQLFFTGAMLFLALLVLWFSLAMFAPIVEVIWRLA
jgi:type II secretory pathway component PulF